MGSRSDALSRFAELVARPETGFDLAEAALLIGMAGDPGTEIGPWLAELDGYARGLGSVDDLRARFFGELGFRGDTQTYYIPQNSFLHRVMERRKGIPISLSVLVVEIGRRAGIGLDAVGMPGHFLVGLRDGRYLDAFDAGRILDHDACEARFREATGAGPAVPFGPELLVPVGPYAILARMLANLQAVYAAQQSGTDLEWVARLALALPDAGAEEAMALASALELQGRFLDAARELEDRADETAEGAALTTLAQRIRSRFN